MFKERVIFMGTPEIASVYLQSLIDSHFNIVAVYTQPPRKKGRGMQVQESSVQKLASKTQNRGLLSCRFRFFSSPKRTAGFTA